MRTLLAAIVLAATSVDLPPVDPATVTAGYRPPSTAFGAGHRGVDFSAPYGTVLRAPIAGVISFAGRVGGKDVVAISDGRRLVSLEPAISDAAVGSAVHVGSVIGRTGVGGHCSLRCVHLGLRIDGRYVAPLGTHARLVP